MSYLQKGNTLKFNNFQYLQISFIIVVVLTIYIPIAPFKNNLPLRDSGVFLYVGSEILDGKILYRDVWDHKPPAIHFINAFGLLIANGSRWGVWSVEILILSVTGILSTVFLKRWFGNEISLLTTLIWLNFFNSILEGGNLPEEYGLILQFLLLLTYTNLVIEKRRMRIYILMGVILSISFLLKQTLIGIGFSIILVTLIAQIRNRDFLNLFKCILFIFIGFSAVLFFVILYFWSHNALSDIFNTTVIYNLRYIKFNESSHLNLLLESVKVLFRFPIFNFSIISWVICSIWIFSKAALNDGMISRLILVGVIDLPIEIIMGTITGRSYPHYLIPFIPTFSILFSFSFYLILKIILSAKNIKNTRKEFVIGKSLLKSLIIIIPLILFGTQLLVGVEILRSRPIGENREKLYLVNKTKEEDFILMWGAESSFNFVTKRKSPTKYVYQYPILAKKFHSDLIINDFIDEVRCNQPKLIVDTSSTNQAIPPLDIKKRLLWNPPSGFSLHPSLENFFIFVSENYEEVGTIGEKSWIVYEDRYD